MARIRSINPCAPVDEDVATMSIWAKYVWAYLPCYADREGRLADKPFTIKLDILPTENVDMNAILAELAERRHIIRYQVDGRRYIQIRQFEKHQRPHKNETPSRYPEVPSDTSLQIRDKSGALPEPDGQRQELEAHAALGSGSSGSGVLDPVITPPPARSDTPRPWTAYDWERRYSARWCETYGGTAMGGGPPVAKATGDLFAILEELTPAERLEAQGRAPDMFAEFFGRQTLRRQRHPWSIFVEDFSGLRKPMIPEKNTGPPRTRDVRIGHAAAPQNYEYPDGEQPL